MNFLPYCTAFHNAKSRIIVVFSPNFHAVFRMPPRRSARFDGLQSASICNEDGPFGPHSSLLPLPGSGLAGLAGSGSASPPMPSLDEMMRMLRAPSPEVSSQTTSRSRSQQPDPGQLPDGPPSAPPDSAGDDSDSSSSSSAGAAPHVPSGLGLGFPNSAFDINAAWCDVDGLIVNDLRVARLNAIFGTYSFFILKPHFVEHRGFTETLAEGCALFFGELGGFQIIAVFASELQRDEKKAVLIGNLQSPIFFAGAVLPSPDPSILVLAAVTISFPAFIEILGNAEIVNIAIARHGQKVPRRVAVPLLQKIRNNCTSISIDIAFSWPVASGVPLFRSSWAPSKVSPMFAELGLVPVGSRLKQFGFLQYPVPAHYGAPGSKIVVYPGSYMHHAKAILGNPAAAPLPATFWTLRNRLDHLRSAASQLAPLIRSNSVKFSTVRLEVSISHTRDIYTALQLAGTGVRFRV